VEIESGPKSQISPTVSRKQCAGQTRERVTLARAPRPSVANAWQCGMLDGTNARVDRVPQVLAWNTNHKGRRGAVSKIDVSPKSRGRRDQCKRTSEPEAVARRSRSTRLIPRSRLSPGPAQWSAAVRIPVAGGGGTGDRVEAIRRIVMPAGTRRIAHSLRVQAPYIGHFMSHRWRRVNQSADRTATTTSRRSSAMPGRSRSSGQAAGIESNPPSAAIVG
jgi:hypothetical protein